MLAQLPEDQLATMLTSFAEEVFRLRAGQAQQAQQSAAGVPTADACGPVAGSGLFGGVPPCDDDFRRCQFPPAPPGA
eukprot:7976049-Alexandrium_andersonii.AAC.1